MTQSDFQRQFSREEMPLAAGSVHGLRTWKVRSDGMLTGQRGKVWRSGINEATCLPEEMTFYRSTRCEGLDPKCSCGVYAYWTKYAAAIQTEAVGVVEGFGRTIIGTRGFRCQKARIVAIVAPEARAETLTYVDGTTETIPIDLAAQIQKRYPEIAIYQDIDAMLAEHPLTEAPEAEPELPYDRGGVWSLPPGVTVHRGQIIGTTGPHLHYQPSVNWATLQKAWADLAASVSYGGYISPSNAQDQLQDDAEEAKRQRALEAKKNRGNGPSRACLPILSFGVVDHG